MCNKPCDANVYGLVVFLYIIKNHALFACSTKFSIFDDFLFLFLFFWGEGGSKPFGKSFLELED